jgi:site-specific DNA-methyltransferase (adenine-specific)
MCSIECPDDEGDVMQLYNGDCLEIMKDIPDGSIDMVLTDPPYGTTACEWDSIIPLEPMWEQLKRIIKPNGPIVMTASQPFTTTLIASNMKMFKYCWVWEKDQGVNFQLAKKQPLKIHEDICVFYSSQPTYNPQGLQDCEIIKSNKGKGGTLEHCSSEGKRKHYMQTKKGYPRTIQKFLRDRGLHPTQKPVALMEYLIKTYTNEGETVLDFTMGSGTTGVACVNTNRNFIGIELDPTYFEIAKRRIEDTEKEFVYQSKKNILDDLF